MATNPFTDYMQTQAAQEQLQYDAQYKILLDAFNSAVATYQANAQRQYDIDKTVIAAPAVPVKKTATYDPVKGVIVEGTWTDPNLHSPVFVPAVAPKPAPLPDISGAATLDQVAGLLVELAKKIDQLLAK